MKTATAVVDLGYGDAGKGSLVDALTRHLSADLVVRFNGGAQAAHRVVSGARSHVFSQWGSGTLAGARTFLSRYMLVDPLALYEETHVGGFDPEMLIIDPAALIVTPYHRLASQRRETRRGAKRHGSVGMGIGEARLDYFSGLALTVGGVADADAHRIVRASRQRRIDSELLSADDGPDPDEFIEACREVLNLYHILPWATVAERSETVIFEGAQGVLLDEAYGFFPYNTWTCCTFRNAERLMQEVSRAKMTRVGVMRSYMTRHGPGPFVTEDWGIRVPEAVNGNHPWMGPFRQGHMDLVAIQYALRSVGGVDALAVNHCDQKETRQVCLSYAATLPVTWSAQFLKEVIPIYEGYSGSAASFVRDTLGVPVIEGHGPQAADKDLGNVFRKGPGRVAAPVLQTTP